MQPFRGEVGRAGSTNKGEHTLVFIMLHEIQNFFFFSILKYPTLLISIFPAAFPNYKIGAILLLQSVAHHRFLAVQCSCSLESTVRQAGGPSPRSQKTWLYDQSHLPAGIRWHFSFFRTCLPATEQWRAELLHKTSTSSGFLIVPAENFGGEF